MQPRPYKDFGRQFVAGEWREGRSTEHIIVDENPYSREVVLRIPGAVPDDVDTAYKEARRAQVDWAAKLPRERAEVLLAAARVFEARHQEIVDWLAREAGATRFGQSRYPATPLYVAARRPRMRSPRQASSCPRCSRGSRVQFFGAQ